MTSGHSSWSKQEEQRWKKQLEQLFNQKLHEALDRWGSPLEVGNHLGEILRGAEIEVVKLVVPRAARKWASPENLSLWEEMIDDDKKLLELRVIGTSIANTLRPLAGNTFAQWVATILNTVFDERGLPLQCVTKGKHKRELAKRLVIQGVLGTQDYKPDLDLIILNVQTQKPIAIISAKTTPAERVMQTINWKRFKEQLPEDVRSMQWFLVTAWKTFDEGSANRQRVQELDGVYVCNANANFSGNIKPFATLINDVAALV